MGSSGRDLVRGVLLGIAVAAAAAGCAGNRAERADGADPAPREEPVIVKKAAAPATAAPAAPIQWEAWPPADAVNEPREPATGETFELKCPPGGMPMLDLIAYVSERTGAVIAFDTLGNQKLKTTKFEWFGTWRVQTSRLVDALRTALAAQNMVLVPLASNGGASNGGATVFMVYDQNNPQMKSLVEWVPESRVLGLVGCDGRYICTVLRIRDVADTSRVRQSLSAITTQIAGIGRVQDVQGGRAILVADFAPVVAAMKRIVDTINATAVPPSAPGGAPPSR